MINRRHTLAAVVGLLAALPASAVEPPKPRVLVILDTSKSMTELPKFTVPSDEDVTIPMSAAGGDYDPTIDNDCDNKFCTAKKVVHRVLPQFTDDARIGVTTYYQYVLRADSADTRNTRCEYDVLSPVNVNRSFTSLTDFTSSLTTVGVSTASPVFPTSSNGGTGGIQSTCRNVAANFYTLTKTAYTPGTPVTCPIFTSPIPALPKTYTGITVSGGCQNNIPYETSNPPTIIGGALTTPSGYLEQTVNLSTTSCGAAGAAGTPNTMSLPASPAQTMTAATGSWGASWNTGGFTANCSSTATGAPCTLYLTDVNPETRNTNRSWYGFFNGTFTPAAAYAGGAPAGFTNTYSFSANVGGAAYTANLLTGNVTLAVATACPATGRYTGGETLSSFGIANARTTLDASGISRGARTHETPTRVGTGTDFNCVPGWPCDVTLTADTPIPGTWVAIGNAYVNNPALLAANQRYSGTSGNNNVVLRATNPAVTSCPAPASTGAAPTNTTWTTAPGGCTGAGLYACAFNSATPTTITAPSGTCNTGQTTMVNTSPGVCSWNGKSYTSGGTTAVTVTANIAATASCVTGSLTLTGATQSGQTFSGCSSYPCAVTYANSSAGPVQSSSWVNQRSSPPSGYSGTAARQQNKGGTTQSSPAVVAPTCLGSPGANLDGVTDSTACGGTTPCSLTVVGIVQTSATGCGSEGDKPCKVCRYQPLQFQWDRATTNCNYNATRYTWNVDRTTLQCTYQRPWWGLEQQNPSTHVCSYAVGANRYDFNQPNTKVCKYWAVRTEIVSNNNMYTYAYKTNGTEIIGRAEKNVPNENFCGANGSGTYTGAFAATCPAVIPNCESAGLANLSTSLGGAIPAGSTCKLRWGGETSSGQPVSGSTASGRWTNFNNNRSPSIATGCSAAEGSLPASPDSYQNSSGSPKGFCTNSGVPAGAQFRLVSDYYDPANDNNITIFNADFPSPTYTKSWSNTAFKEQGFGAKKGAPAIPSGAMTQSPYFVPIPEDTAYDGAAQRAAIKALAGKCVLPNSSSVTAGPNPVWTPAGGACVVDLADKDFAGWTSKTDYTPLYGSLKNSYDYLFDRWSYDDGTKECRDYYIVLATDGLENTPKGYQVSGSDPATTVQGLVGSFRNNAPPPPATRTAPDVKTFVIGFGEGAAGAGGLDAIAATGGTNQAYSARSIDELETALRAVFTVITQGTYTRSKPALSTDGTRLYSAQFIRPTIGPDWRGMLTAYRILTDGSLQVAWEHGTKLDAQGARDIRAVVRDRNWPYDRWISPFTSADGELYGQLNDHWDYPGHWDLGCSCWVEDLNRDDILAFLRDQGHSYYGMAATRTSRLGPIVMSAPVVIGKSPFDREYGGSTTTAQTEFSNFIANASNSRPIRVMFAANDAMLHAVADRTTDPDCASLGESNDACDNGRETWALIPGSLKMGEEPGHGQPRMLETLYKMMKGNWLNFDGTVSVADVCDHGGDAKDCVESDWKTILIGVQRGGGRGMLALDVTTGGAPNTSQFLWDYADYDLGYTYSVPAIGRVKRSGKEEFVAVFGGGMDDPDEAGTQGDRVYVINALNGYTIKSWDDKQKGGSTAWLNDPIVSRPSTHRRRAKSFMDSAYLGIGPTLNVLRFVKSDFSVEDDADKWKPDEFFDPTDGSGRNDMSALNVAQKAKVNEVIETINPAPAPPTYSLQYVQDLPLASAPPIWNRPKMATELDPSGNTPDLFVGTGNIADPQNPGMGFSSGNYFYAVHDFNLQLHGDKNDGRAMWVVKFGGKEQVVSEPAIISGAVIVATYTPPSVGSLCGQEGDTTLYSFRPHDGALVPALIFPAGSPYAGQSTSVVKMTGVGIPSDLVVVNDNVYLATSQGGVQRAPVRPAPQAGDVRSYRRLK